MVSAGEARAWKEAAIKAKLRRHYERLEADIAMLIADGWDPERIRVVNNGRGESWVEIHTDMQW